MNTANLKSWTFSLLLAVFGTQAWSYGNSMPAPASEAIAHTAEVLETMSSAGYTYVRVREEDKEFWIALPETPVKVGERISFYEQMLMENFTSPSLGRTFDRILFVEAVNKGSDLPGQAGGLSSPHKAPPVQQAVLAAAVEIGDAEGRFTIQEVFEKKTDLNGKTLEVKGRIVKLSRQIMARDWVHLEDGTGSGEDKNNKIVFRTTQGGMAVGDEVVAKGVLHVDKDFGYGYFYPVIVEDAVFSKH